MSAKSTKKTADQDLQTVAAKFAERLIQTANDQDPKREAEFQKREAAREEVVTRALKEHLAKKKK
jgi:hypothetical protein